MVCADVVILDQFLQTISIVNLLEAIHPERFPIVIPRVCCLAILAREAADVAESTGRMVIKLGDTELARSPFDIKFKADQLRTRALVVVQGLLIPGPGTVRATFELNDARLGTWDISFDSAPAQTSLPFQQPG